MTDPEAGRNESRARRQAWAAWLNDAMARAQVTPGELRRLSSGQPGVEILSASTIIRWRSGALPPSPAAALVVARLLDADPVEALRAGGHDLLANAMARLDSRSLAEVWTEVAEARTGVPLEPALRAALVQEVERVERAIAERLAEVQESAPHEEDVPEAQDPVFSIILASPLSKDAQWELLSMRADDLNRIETEAREAEERLLAIVRERIELAVAGPTPGQVRAALAEFSDVPSMRVWDEFLDRHYARARDTGSFEVVEQFLAGSWGSVLACRRARRDGPPPVEARVSGEEFVSAWEGAHPGQKLAV